MDALPGRSLDSRSRSRRGRSVALLVELAAEPLADLLTGERLGRRGGRLPPTLSAGWSRPPWRTYWPAWRPAVWPRSTTTRPLRSGTRPEARRARPDPVRGVDPDGIVAVAWGMVLNGVVALLVPVDRPLVAGAANEHACACDAPGGPPLSRRDWASSPPRPHSDRAAGALRGVRPFRRSLGGGSGHELRVCLPRGSDPRLRHRVLPRPRLLRPTRLAWGFPWSLGPARRLGCVGGAHRDWGSVGAFRGGWWEIWWRRARRRLRRGRRPGRRSARRGASPHG